MTATYTKLRSGDWGIRVQGDGCTIASLHSGLSIAVAKRDGSTRHETIDRVVWRDGRTAICAIRAQSRNRSRSNDGLRDAYRHGWDGKIGSPSYYSSGAFDELDM